MAWNFWGKKGAKSGLLKGTNIGNPWAVATDLETSYTGSTDAALGAQLDALAKPPTAEDATARARPILDAINAAAGFKRPGVRDVTFAGDAEAGFGLSGRAVTNVQRALGDFDAGVEGQRQAAIRQAMADITQENQAAATNILNQETLKTNKEANKRRRFLGIF